jgi:hypothetical protein
MATLSVRQAPAPIVNLGLNVELELRDLCLPRQCGGSAREYTFPVRKRLRKVRKIQENPRED